VPWVLVDLDAMLGQNLPSSIPAKANHKFRYFLSFPIVSIDMWFCFLFFFVITVLQTKFMSHISILFYFDILIDMLIYLHL